MWNLSDDTVRKMIETDPDVLVVHRPKKLGGKRGGYKRAYNTYSVPESVAKRIYEKYKGKPKDDNKHK